MKRELPEWATPDLAFDLAAQLISTPDICTLHEITSAELREVMSDHRFLLMVRDAKLEWESPRNSERRVRVKALMAAEASLGDVYDIVRSKMSNDSDRLNAYKLLMQSADVPMGGRSTAGDGGGGTGLQQVNVNISLHGDDKPHSISLSGGGQVLDAEIPKIPSRSLPVVDDSFL